jgi:hypothetical protein
MWVVACPREADNFIERLIPCSPLPTLPTSSDLQQPSTLIKTGNQTFSVKYFIAMA